MNRKLALVAAPLLLVTMASMTWAPPVPFHPHFPKQLECRISRDLTVTINYQTVTFDSAGAEKMAAGKAWHLAGATFTTTGDLVIGGKPVEAGRYALSARKTADSGWELTLHEGRGFSRPGDDAIALATELDKESMLYEHMNIDVQPAGDKEHTRLQLEVRFDRLWARTLIEVPNEKGGDKDSEKKKKK